MVIRPGTVIEDGTIVIRDGRITSVRGAEDWPADHRLLDMTGKTIYAGLIDGYREEPVTISEPPEHAVYWNVNIRPERSTARLLSLDESRVQDLMDSGITAALVSPGEGIFKGSAALVLVSTDRPETSVLKPDVAQSAELTVPRRFGGPRLYPSSPMGAVALARQALYDAIWYRDAWRVANEHSDVNRPEINASLAALQPVVAGEMPILVTTTNELMALRADRFAREFGVQLIIVGSGNEYRRLQAIAELQRPLVVPLNFPDPPNVETADDAREATLESLMHWDLAPENPARLAGAGVEFAFTSQGLDDADELLKRVRQAVARGLDPETALAALTTVPAAICGAADQVGSIETGKLANLVVADGDLFDKETKVLETWVAGRRHVVEEPPERQMGGKWRLESPASNRESGSPEMITETFELVIRGQGQQLSGTWSMVESKPDQAPAEDKTAEDKTAEDKTAEDKTADKTAEDKTSAPAGADKMTEVKDLKLQGSRLSGSFRARIPTIRKKPVGPNSRWSSTPTTSRAPGCWCCPMDRVAR